MRFLAFALIVIISFASFGSNRADSVKVYFRIGSRHFEPGLGENRKVMDDFVGMVREAAAAGKIERIIVRGSASPDGIYKANMRLAANRSASIVEYLAVHTGVSSDLIEEAPAVIGWEELRRLVAENAGVPCREEVLEILDNMPDEFSDVNGEVADGLKKRLMNLRGGVPYGWMVVNLFSELRNSVAVLLCLTGTEDPVLPQEGEKAAADETAVSHAPKKGSDNGALGEKSDGCMLEESPVSTGGERMPARFALKNNLLYDAALMPNLELEWMFANRWSASLEAAMPWYKSGAKAYRLAMVSPELRYWTLERKPWHGLYVGAFVGAGIYELGNNSEGYEGEGAMGGVSAGYMWPISKYLSLETGLGIGYMYTRFREYDPNGGHYVYLRTKNLNYFGPLKLKLSLAWRFGRTGKSIIKESAK